MLSSVESSFQTSPKTLNSVSVGPASYILSFAMVNTFMFEGKANIPSMVVCIYHRFRRSMFLDKALQGVFTSNRDDFTNDPVFLS